MSDSSIMQSIMEYVRALAEDIGPRGPTTEGEERAARYIHSTLSKQGMEVWKEDFYSPSTFSWYYAFPNFIIFLSFIVFLYHPLIGVLLSIIGAIFFFTEINTIETISRFFPKKKSANVVGKLSTREPARERIIIVTHHDTSKPSMSFDPRYIRYFRISIVMMIFSAFMIPVMLGLELFLGSGGILPVLTGPLALYLLVSVFVLVHRELVYEPVCGANDNASGTGVMLALGETLTAHPPKNTEVWFLSTGCEEVGAIGMMRFLEKHGKELGDAYFINIDNVGKGTVSYTKGEGLVKAFSCSEELEEIARKSSRTALVGAKGFISKIYPTNTLPCLVRNHKAISILATDDKGLIYNWHWETDTWEKLDEHTLCSVYKLVLEMVRTIDSIA
ncbi:MAG: M28 family peptidase [Thermoplasmata archaeon]|nr:MAG: M28 family peptidase [Thermoplasmata archaeon]